MSTARRASQGYGQLASKRWAYHLVALLCLVPLPMRAYETPLLNHSGSLPASPIMNLRANIKDQHPFSHEQLQQRLQLLMSNIRQQSLVDAAAAADNDVDAIGNISMAANATNNVTTEANIPTGGALYFGAVGNLLAPGLLLTGWHQHPAAAKAAATEAAPHQHNEIKTSVAQIQKGNVTSQPSTEAVANITTSVMPSAPAGSSGAKFTVPHPPSVRTPTHRTLRRARPLSRAQGIRKRTIGPAAAADAAERTAQAATAAAGAAHVPAGKDKDGSGKPLCSKRALLSVSDSVGAAQNKGPVPTPAAGAVTPPHHKQQQQQRSVTRSAQAARRSASATAVKVPNSTSTSEQGPARVLPGGGRGHKRLSVSNGTAIRNSTFTAVEGVIQQGMARVLLGGGRGHKLLSAGNASGAVAVPDSTAAEGAAEQDMARVLPGGGHGPKLLSVSNVKPSGYRTAPAVRPSGSQQQIGRHVRVQLQPGRQQQQQQQQQRGSWAKCSWWNKVMTLVDAVMQVNGRRKRC